jgi:hypothetical protein
MTMTSRESAHRKRLMVVPVLVLGSAALSGCISGPTYGTGKGANAQLFEDVSSILSFAPKGRGEQIEYAPRAELVKPASTEVLPPPQDDITAREGAWPESPEQRLARVRKEATENRDNPSYRANVIVDVKAPEANNLSPQEQRAEFQRRKRETQQGSPTQRKYLSEPPLDYRTPSDSAPAGELGEPEWRKERDAKRAAREASGKKSWYERLPFM